MCIFDKNIYKCKLHDASLKYMNEFYRCCDLYDIEILSINNYNLLVSVYPFGDSMWMLRKYCYNIKRIKSKLLLKI